MGKYYIVRGAKMQCDKGSNCRKINLPVSHGSYAKDSPILVKTDSKPVENIPYFGVCKNEDQLPEKIDITVINKDGAVQTGKKCMLQINGDWKDTKDDNIVDGQPALTTDSKLFCNCLGVITFENHGQD